MAISTGARIIQPSIEGTLEGSNRGGRRHELGRNEQKGSQMPMQEGRCDYYYIW